MDYFYAISDMGPLPIIGSIIVVALFIKAIMGKGKGNGNSSNNSSSSSSSTSNEEKK